MVKIFKSNNGKLVIYLPFDVIEDLKLKDGEEVDFFKMNERSYLLAKKSDITGMILGKENLLDVQKPDKKQYGISSEELSVLKKINTIRYSDRTRENVMKLLSEHESKILQKLILNGSILPFKKNSKELYSISKNVYELLKPVKLQETQTVSIQKSSPIQPYLEDDNVKLLETNGFIVLQTEAEASRLSLSLEQSIRHGQILGTRGFNKKFYIVMRSFFDRYGQLILKKLRERPYRIQDLSKEISINEDGARSILYLLSENGDISEKKKDVFTIA
jgi:hypothetical protein